MTSSPHSDLLMSCTCKHLLRVTERILVNCNRVWIRRYCFSCPFSNTGEQFWMCDRSGWMETAYNPPFLEKSPAREALREEMFQELFLLQKTFSLSKNTQDQLQASWEARKGQVKNSVFSASDVTCQHHAMIHCTPFLKQKSHRDWHDLLQAYCKYCGCMEKVWKEKKKKREKSVGERRL